MRFFIIILAFLVIGCVATERLAPPATTISAWPTSSIPLGTVKGLSGPVPKDTASVLNLYVESFDRLVFESEYHGPDPWVRKWARVIHYRVLGPASSEHRKIVSNIISLLADITGLDFRNKGRANFSIVFSEKKVCSGNINLYRNGSFVDANVWIGTEFAVAECVAEEISQVMGPFNDVAIVEQSLWRPHDQKTALSLTWHDAVILRTLYDDRIRPGMHRDVALPIVETIIGELLAELNREVRAN